MQNKNIDYELLNIFSTLIKDEQEVETLKMIFSGDEDEKIVASIIKSIGENTDDQH